MTFCGNLRGGVEAVCTNAYFSLRTRFLPIESCTFKFVEILGIFQKALAYIFFITSLSNFTELKVLSI